LFYELREQLHQGKLPGADMLGADRGLGVAGGAPPAAAINVADDQLDRPETPAAARAAVQAAKARGADLVKFWLDDFRGSVPVKMTPEIYAAIIDEAHLQDLRVAAHVYYLNDAKALAKAGVDILAHGIRDQPVDDELIGLLKANSVWYIATIGVDESAYIYADRPDWIDQPFFIRALQPAVQAQFASAAWRDGVLANPKLAASREAVQMNQRNLAALHQGGVQIAFGADSGANPLRIPGFAEHRELVLMGDAGLTPLDALTAATGDSAKALGLNDRGVIAAGKLADLIVLDADPIADIESTQRIHAVWHRGEKVVAGE
jgi:imidazolonepropionase-like amidohydrolase